MRFASPFLLTATLLLAFANPSSEKQSYRFNYRMRTVVIDAGHGGHDAGCHGNATNEKTVTLAIALKLGALIEKNLPGTRVIYTRKTDEFIELNERAAIANRNNADLFVCIHCNANPNKDAYGTESWTMGLHKTEGNLEVAKRENSVILMENDYKNKYDGFDPNSPEAYIVFSLNQSAFINQSIDLASQVEDEFKRDGRSSRGVKQAGFLVLWKTVMPSTLIETGFLTNAKEEKYLSSESGQIETAQSIFDAVSRYKNKMENEVNSLFSKDDRTLTGAQPDTIPTREKTQVTVKPKVVPAKADSIDVEKVNAVLTNVNATTYRVQIAASTRPIDTKSTLYAKVNNATCTVEQNTYRVYTGSYESLDEAKAQRRLLQEKGFKDAFVVEFQNNKRVKAVY